MARRRPPITRANPRVINGQRYESERQYRNELRRRKQSPGERSQALDLLARIRRGEDLDLAVGFSGIEPARAQLYVGMALHQDERGRWSATPYDRLPRGLHVLTPGGWEPVVVRDSRTATLLGEHAAAVRSYAVYGNLEGLRQFRGRSFQASGVKYRLLDDRDEAVLRRLVLANVVSDLLDLYQDGLISDAGFT